MYYQYVIYEGEPHKGIWQSVYSNKETAKKIINGTVKYILKYRGKKPFTLKKYKSYTSEEIRKYLKENKKFIKEGEL